MAAMIENKVQPKSALQLKGGLYHLMTLKLLTADLSMLEEQLSEQILQAPNFFRNASIVIDLQQISKSGLDNASQVDLVAIAALLRRKGLYPTGITHANEEQRTQANKIGLATLYSNNNSMRQNNPSTQNSQTPKVTQPMTVTANNINSADTNSEQNIASNNGSKLINSPVRSGQQVYAPDGDLIITSSVSNGAEIIAEGNIHVYGTLRGRALAGINGNQEARIFCKSLEAELISIAGQYKISEDFAREHWKCAVEISLKEGRLQINAL